MIWMQKILLCLALGFITTIAFSKDYILTSPDKKIKINISVEKNITWSINYNNETLLNASPLSIELTNGNQLGIDPVVINAFPKSVSSSITAIIPVKNRIIPDVYNELLLQSTGNYSVNFWAYNDGAAYRFETNLPDNIIEVKNETAGFNLAENYHVFWPKENNPNFQSHYEPVFSDTAVAEISNKTYGYLPLLFTSGKGTKLLITEADLYDYPNLFLFGTGSTKLTAAFPPVILEKNQVMIALRSSQKKLITLQKLQAKELFPGELQLLQMIKVCLKPTWCINFQAQIFLPKQIG